MLAGREHALAMLAAQHATFGGALPLGAPVTIDGTGVHRRATRNIRNGEDTPNARRAPDGAMRIGLSSLRRHAVGGPVAAARLDKRARSAQRRLRRLPRPIMNAPDYATIEALIRQVLDQLRAAHMMLARGEAGTPLRVALRDAIEAHAELTDRMNADALDAHAAGHIFAVVLGERIGGVSDLANELRGPDEPPHPQATPAAAILRRYPSRVEAD